MEGLRHDSDAARFIVEALREPFVLIDVGCSGGIQSAWSVFGDKLQAYAFDPSIAEIERLAKAETRPGIRYIPAFVAAPADHPIRDEQPGLPFYRRNPSDRLAWRRTSVLKEARESGASSPSASDAFAISPAPPGETPVSGPFSLDAAPATQAVDSADDVTTLLNTNDWHKSVLADRDRPISLPRFLDTEGVASVDFIKIDCDGPDFEILSSLEAVLDTAQVVALSVEVNFIGGAASNHHTFHNTDRFMRRNDFDLADLTVRRYASSALPFLYTDPHPFYNRNLGGRPYQGDALYARDFGWTDTFRQAAGFSDDKLLKLAAVMALFGRVDQTAELLVMFRSRLSARLDVDKALDLLTREIHDLQAPLFDAAEQSRTYGQYMAAFEADDPSAYNAVRRQDAWTADLQSRAAARKTEADEAARSLAEKTDQLNDVLGSTSWRITAPLRKLFGGKR